MANHSLDIRRYQGLQDLGPLLEFASRSFAERLPLNACWHPGDIAWQLMPAYDRPHRVGMWRVDGHVEAITMFSGADQVSLEVLPQADELLSEIVTRAEQSMLRTGQRTLSIRASESDTRRIAALEALGYIAGAPEGVSFRIDLARPLKDSPVPPGFRLRDSVGVDPGQRAKAHGEAWNDLSEIGIPNAQSEFSEERYRGLRTAPNYDPTLDILIEADDGTFVANALCWADAKSGVAIFEPVGTHASYRKRGLAKLAMGEALRRVRERNLKTARVSTAHFNLPAIRAYSGAGFELFDRTRWWTKPLIPS